MSDPRPGYPSDLSLTQWERIEPFLPPHPSRGRPRSLDPREVVNGINYRWSTGCSWRMLPHDFPSWGSVYAWFRRWERDGTLTRIRNELIRKNSVRNVERSCRDGFDGRLGKPSLEEGS